VAEHLTGWREEDARGKPLSEVFHILNEDTLANVEIRWIAFCVRVSLSDWQTTRCS